MKMKVIAKIQGKNIRCEVLHSFGHKVTKKSYIIIFDPFSAENDVIIPLLFNPDKDIQDAVFLTEEQDISVIEEIINKDACEIKYECSDGMIFEVHISQSTNNDLEEFARKLAEINRLGRFTPQNIDEEIKRIDAKLVRLAGEEFFSELEQKETNQHSLASGLILSIIKEDISLTHYPLNIIDNLLDLKPIEISAQDMILLKMFQGVIVAFGKSEIVRQDIENALVAFVECENCTKELFDAIINHKTFLEVFSRDIIQSVRSNIVLRVPNFFDLTAIKTAANYYYAKREYENSLNLFEKLYAIIKENEPDSKEILNILNSIGCCFVSIMQFEKAYKAFKEATEMDNNYAIAYNNWAYTIAVECDTLSKGDIRQQKLQEALAYINDAIQLNTSDVSFVSNRAFIEYELGQYKQVIRDFKRAKEISKKYADISTILKLTIDSRIMLSIDSPELYHVDFIDLYDDLRLIYNNETGGNKFYFEALDVYDKISSYENNENVRAITSELMLLEFYIKELMSSIAVKNPYQKIYYYTSMNSLQKLLCDENATVKYRLPIFSANHMNDPSEGQELEKAFFQYVGNEPMVQDLFNHSDKFSDTKRRRLEAEFTFLKAFTKSDDSLPMWVHYANEGKGCCVRVNSRFFTNFDSDLSDNEKTLTSNPFDYGYCLYEILYIQNGKIANKVPDRVKELYAKIFEKVSLLSSLYANICQDTRKAVVFALSKMINKLRYLFKSIDYIYEQEMRIVLNRPLSDLERDDIDIQMTSATTENPIPKVFIYTDKSLSIEEIILGPKVNETDDIIPFLAMKLLKINDYEADKVLITKSAIEYR